MKIFDVTIKAKVYAESAEEAQSFVDAVELDGLIVETYAITDEREEN